MFIKWILPILALVGFISAVRVVISNSKPVLPAEAVSKPSVSPYDDYISGAGIVEANTENIAVSTNISGVVKEVYVTAGQFVKKSDSLFQIDDREARATLAVELAALNAAQSELLDAKEKFDRSVKIKNNGALSEEEISSRKYGLQVAEAKLNQAKAQVDFRNTEIDRLTVRSLIDAEILKVNVRPGEYASASALSQPLMLIGNTKPLYVRVDVDENDAWEVQDQAKAVAFLRGNVEINTKLEFVRFEPYVIPKKSLTGESSERVDTRVLQIIFKISDSNFKVFPGQLLDIYISSK